MPTTKQAKRHAKGTGRINVYIRFDVGFFGRLRPAYDAAADAIGEVTEAEASTLRSMIHRYLGRCHKRHGKEKLDAAVNDGAYG